MALTEKQDIPLRPQVTEPWTRKTLLAIQTTAQTLARVFTALEVVLFFMVLVSGLGELFGRNLSWGWYILLILVLVSNLYLRALPKPEPETKIKK